MKKGQRQIASVCVWNNVKCLQQQLLCVFNFIWKMIKHTQFQGAACCFAIVVEKRGLDVEGFRWDKRLRQLCQSGSWIPFKTRLPSIQVVFHYSRLWTKTVPFYSDSFCPDASLRQVVLHFSQLIRFRTHGLNLLCAFSFFSVFTAKPICYCCCCLSCWVGDSRVFVFVCVWKTTVKSYCGNFLFL